MTIPLCAPAVRDDLALSILSDLDDLLRSGKFIGGEPVDAFEQEWASYCGREFCVGTSSGTDALRLSLMATKAQGSRVIVPAMTFAATYEAVLQAGYFPLPVDVLPNGMLDPGLVEQALKRDPDVAAIILVHLYGQIGETEVLAAIAERRGIPLVHDACQAHGIRTTVEGIDAWSFYPTKNLGAIGDAGAITTDDPRIAKVARALTQHGQASPYQHHYVGYTARLDTIQAAALLRKLPYLGSDNQARHRAASFYHARLTGVGDLRLPGLSAGVWHLYSIRTQDPVGVAHHLLRRGIQTGRHYPVPPPLSAAFASLGYLVGDFPVAEEIGRQCLSLPLWPGISETEQETVVAAIEEWFA